MFGRTRAAMFGVCSTDSTRRETHYEGMAVTKKRIIKPPEEKVQLELEASLMEIL